MEDAREWDAPWRKWGPYLSERQWGTVREDYSQNGDAWEYFTHDHARSRAYHWGEDGLAGFCDLKQRLCFALALWNGKDPILKERLFGLSNAEGNHGEDVKEYYFYLDSTPTHSYMKWLYKYPQAAFPYDDLVETNARRTRAGSRVRAHRHRRVRRRPLLRRLRRICQVVSGGMLHPDHRREPRSRDRDDSSAAHPVVPQYLDLVARNGETPPGGGESDPTARASWRRRTRNLAIAGSTAMERRRCCSPRTRPTPSGSSARPTPAPMSRTPSTRSSCTESRRGQPGAGRHQGRRALSSRRWRRPVGRPSGSASPMRRRRTRPFAASTRRSRPGVARRTSSTDPARRDPPSEDTANVMRQAFGGLFWTKQYYFFDVNMWLREHGVIRSTRRRRSRQEPPLVPHVQRRRHLDAGQVGVPVVRGWDLAFHAVALSRRRSGLCQASAQPDAEARFLHSNGQMPAYEWNFSDVNPPVHAWATLFQYRIEQAKRGKGDVEFLKRAFGKLSSISRGG